MLIKVPILLQASGENNNPKLYGGVCEGPFLLSHGRGAKEGDILARIEILKMLYTYVN